MIGRKLQKVAYNKKVSNTFSWGRKWLNSFLNGPQICDLNMNDNVGWYCPVGRFYGNCIAISEWNNLIYLHCIKVIQVKDYVYCTYYKSGLCEVRESMDAYQWKHTGCTVLISSWLLFICLLDEPYGQWICSKTTLDKNTTDGPPEKFLQNQIGFFKML